MTEEEHLAELREYYADEIAALESAGWKVRNRPHIGWGKCNAEVSLDFGLTSVSLKKIYGPFAVSTWDGVRSVDHPDVKSALDSLAKKREFWVNLPIPSLDAEPTIVDNQIPESEDHD